MIEMTARVSKFVPHQQSVKVGRRWDGSRTVYSTPSYKRFVREMRSQFAHEGDPYAEPVQVDMLLAFPMTKRHGACVRDREPDVENVAKSVNDALEGFAFDNDRRVAELTVRKVDVLPPCEFAVRVRVQPAAPLTDDDGIGD